MEKTIHSLGIDIGKTWFHLVGMNRAGKPTCRKKVKRTELLSIVNQWQPDLIGMEACAGSQYLAREMIAQGFTVKLMASQFVRPYVKSQKKRFQRCSGHS